MVRRFIHTDTKNNECLYLKLENQTWYKNETEINDASVDFVQSLTDKNPRTSHSYLEEHTFLPLKTHHRIKLSSRYEPHILNLKISSKY